jgi:hypothetical protein
VETVGAPEVLSSQEVNDRFLSMVGEADATPYDEEQLNTTPVGKTGKFTDIFSSLHS